MLCEVLILGTGRLGFTEPTLRHDRPCTPFCSNALAQHIVDVELSCDSRLSLLGQELACQALKRMVFALAGLMEAVSTIFYLRALFENW